MHYCSVDEAFNNSLNKQVERMDNIKINNMKEDNFDTYDKPIPHPEILMKNANNPNNNNIYNNVMSWPKVIDAQGDMNQSGPYFGTPMTDLQKANKKEPSISEEDVFSDDDFEMSPDYNSYRMKRQLNHKYCINKFISIMYESNDMTSMGSSDDADVYDHVKKCKYCKNQINKRMRDMPMDDDVEPSRQPIKPATGILGNKTIETFIPKFDSLGYDFKEIIFIILAGVALVFILDLLVRIGRKMK